LHLLFYEINKSKVKVKKIKIRMKKSNLKLNKIKSDERFIEMITELIKRSGFRTPISNQSDGRASVDLIKWCYFEG
jgi:hypothetical protein